MCVPTDTYVCLTYIYVLLVVRTENILWVEIVSSLHSRPVIVSVIGHEKERVSGGL